MTYKTVSKKTIPDSKLIITDDNIQQYVAYITYLYKAINEDYLTIFIDETAITRNIAKTKAYSRRD